MPAELTLIVCEHLVREAQAVIQAEHITDVTVASSRPTCERPLVVPLGRQQESPNGRRTRDAQERCGYCIAGSGQGVGAREAPGSLESGRCFDLLVGRTQADQYAGEGAYLITPGWLEHWRERVSQWGFDQKSAREFFHESIRRLVLLDTCVYPESTGHLRDLGEYVDLPITVVRVGLEVFRAFLLLSIFKWRLDRAVESQEADRTVYSRRLADYAMVVDLTAGMTTAGTEESAILHVLDLFESLCGPARLAYLPVRDRVALAPICRPGAPEDAEPLQERLLRLKEDWEWTESGSGFRLRIGDREGTLGILEVEDVAEGVREDYLNLGLTAAGVCALAVRNSRTYERLQKTLSDLQAALSEVRTLRGIVPICASCKRIRDDKGFWQQVDVYIRDHTEAEFSHGICPECLRTLYPEFAGTAVASDDAV